MADVFYLLASLPNLDISTLDSTMTQVDGSDIFTLDDFIDACDVLDESYARLVVEAVLHPKESDLAIAKEWTNYEYSIRNELANMRWSHIRSGSYQSVLVHDEIPVTAEAIDLLSFVNRESNPYLREKEIILTKWQVLDSMDAQYQFKLENVIIYGWKLQQYYSYCRITEERGHVQWNTLVHKLAEKSGFSISAINGGL